MTDYEASLRRTLSLYHVTSDHTEEMIGWLTFFHREDMKRLIREAVGPDNDLTAFEEVAITKAISINQVATYEANLIDQNARNNEHLRILHRAGVIESSPNKTYYKKVKR